MLRRANPDFRRLGVVSALIAALPGSLLAQERSTAVLPPPSLFDSAPPSSAQGAAIISAPRAAPSVNADTPAAPAPVRPAEPATTAATVRPAEPATTAATVRPPEPATTAATVRSPEPAMTNSAAAPGSAAAREPWYRRMWGTMTGWFGRKSPPPPPAADPTMVAVAPSTTSTPVSLSSPRASTTVEPSSGYAQDTPDRTIRTGVAGECLKTGMWEPSDVMTGCGAGQTVAKVEERAPMTAAIEPRMEPVEVQPLAAPALKEEKSLDMEPAAAEPMPEPEPVAMPEPPAPQPEMTTLAADALFALGSHQLKPAARASLDEFAAKLQDMDYDVIKITGHTDPTGKAALNDKLSRQRAESVKRYLVSRGIQADRIQTEGVGSSMPMVIETDCAALPRTQKAACYQPDRRVEIEVRGATSRMAAQQ